jgi:hypothetical protein
MRHLRVSVGHMLRTGYSYIAIQNNLFIEKGRTGLEIETSKHLTTPPGLFEVKARMIRIYWFAIYVACI